MRPWCSCMRPREQSQKKGVSRPREPTYSAMNTYWYLVLLLYDTAVLLLRCTLRHPLASRRFFFFFLRTSWRRGLSAMYPRQAAPSAAVHTPRTVQARDRRSHVENVHPFVDNPT